MKLVDDADEQRRLEELLDPSKPPVPAECRDLHYLLFTPFRYAAHSDSRFRRSGRTPPVFYAAEHEATAIAEVAFWRLLFLAESPGTPWPSNPLELTSFSVGHETAACLDLTAPPHAARREDWRHPTDYTAAHEAADRARQLGAEAIRAISARDPEERATISLLTCRAFSARAPTRRRGWRLSLSAAGPFATCDQPRDSLSFGREAFARDPRIAAFDWDR